MVGFDGPTLPGDVAAWLGDGGGGIVLFDRNVSSPRQVFELCRAARLAAAGQLLIGIDQEGGRVARLREGFFAPPAMSDIGASGDQSLAERVGDAMGAELRALGINLNFAPVLDVDTNPDNPVIGSRSFGPAPAHVSAMGVALIRGLVQRGVAACGKHFPGHGDTHQDSHLELPRLSHGRSRLDEVELQPFRAAIAAGVPSIMTAHIVFETLDPERPATMSSAVIDGVLRGELGFEGVVISDDLGMNAIADRHTMGEAMIGGLAAGVDLFLYGQDLGRAEAGIEYVARAIERGELAASRVDQAVSRVHTLASRFSWAMPTHESAIEHLTAAPESLTRELTSLASSSQSADPTRFTKRDS